jgi:3'-5' exoribonuclease
MKAAEIPDIVKAKLLNISEHKPEVLYKAVALCVKSDYAESKTGPYLNLQFKDINGKVITAKKWKYLGSKATAGCYKGQICLIQGNWTEYNNSPQIIVDDIGVLNEDAQANCNISKATFGQKPDQPLEEYARTLLALIQNVVDNDYRKLLDYIFAKRNYIQRYTEVPAGISYHHTGKGQLLQHAVEVATTALATANLYPYMTFNLSLVVAGALLHDIGKVIEMPSDGSMEYTHTGYAVGHIGLASSLLTRFAVETQFPEEKLYDLLSIIMTHHGELEYGSPIKPNSPETMLIHVADMTSSQLNHIWNNAKELHPHQDVNTSRGRNYIRLS